MCSPQRGSVVLRYKDWFPAEVTGSLWKPSPSHPAPSPCKNKQQSLPLQSLRSPAGLLAALLPPGLCPWLKEAASRTPVTMSDKFHDLVIMGHCFLPEGCDRSLKGSSQHSPQSATQDHPFRAQSQIQPGMMHFLQREHGNVTGPAPQLSFSVPWWAGHTQNVFKPQLEIRVLCAPTPPQALASHCPGRAFWLHYSLSVTLSKLHKLHFPYWVNEDDNSPCPINETMRINKALGTAPSTEVFETH